MIGQRFGRYVVVEHLGQGGLASVWKAQDALLGRPVALKILDQKLGREPKARRRFLHEARTQAALDHPGIVRIYDVGESDLGVYLALTLIEGETLAQRLARRLFSIPQALTIVIDAARALDYAHGRGVIHRDVTSRNVMIANDERVYLLDFGLALANWESRLSTSASTMGTAPYIAPELIHGADATASSDVYSLGVVLYECLTGGRPFEGELELAVFYGALNEPPIPLRGRRPAVPERLEQIVLAMIEREVALRVPTVSDLIPQLLEVREGVLPEGGRRTTRSTRARKPSEEATTTSADPTPWPDPLYLAVLPFRTAEDAVDPVDVGWGASLAATLSAELASTDRIRVVPLTPENADRAPRAIAEAIGANALLQGRMTRSGSQLRVTFTVLDPWRECEIAGGVVDGSAFQRFELEDQLVASVRRALRISWAEPPSNRRTETDPAAEERLRLALSYLRRRDNIASVEGARVILEGLIATHDDRAETHALLARTLLVKADLTKERVWIHQAAAACQRACDLDPDAPMVHVAHGDLLLTNGKPAEALSHYERALERSARDYEAVIGRGRALSALGLREEAERAFRDAIEIRPEDWRGYSYLGGLRYRAQDHAGAVECWRKVVVLTPDNALGKRNLGSALYRMDRFEEAVTAYRESLEIQPNARAFTNLGTALYFLGRLEEAIEVLRKAAQLQPSDAEVWGNLGLTWGKILGHELEAAEALDRAIGLTKERLATNPDGESFARLAGYYMGRGLREEGERAIEKALVMAPEDPICLARAATFYLQIGNRDRCVRLLDDAVSHGYGVGELERSTELAPLRSDPEFQRILQKKVVPAGAPAPARVDSPTRKGA